LAFLLLTVDAGKTRSQAQNAPGPQTNEAKILLTAVDKDGRFVNSLRAEDLRVLQDGVPQKVDGFQKVTDRSLSLAILIDTSASQERVLPGQRLAANSFLDSVIRPDRDHVAIATFNDTLTIEQNLTNDLPTLRQAIARAVFVPPPGYVRGGLIIGPPPPVSRAPGVAALGTAVWDVVIDACDNVLSQSSPETRRALILLTDGQDTTSRNKMSAAVDRAARDDVAIYGIGVGDGSMYGVNKDGLRKLSDRTGGRAFFPKRISELTDIFAEIGQELRTQYLISFSSSTRAGASAKIKIEIVNPDLRKSGVQLFYQQIVPNK
jgi:VWFA-related protein